MYCILEQIGLRSCNLSILCNPQYKISFYQHISQHVESQTIQAAPKCFPDVGKGGAMIAWGSISICKFAKFKPLVFLNSGSILSHDMMHRVSLHYSTKIGFLLTNAQEFGDDSYLRASSQIQT